MRTLDPRIFMDEFIGTHSLRLRWLWLGLILSLADDQGRLEDNAAIIRAMIFPHDVKIKVEDIEADLKALAKAHKILRYRAGTNGSGKKLIQIIQWWKHQDKMLWAKRSTFPAPAKWVDRICINEKGSTNKTVLNWDHPGGFAKRVLTRVPTPVHTAVAIGETPGREEKRVRDSESEEKDQEPTHPPTPSRGNERVGGKAGIDPKAEEQLKQLKPKERKEAERLMPILRSFISSETKIITLSVLVAMRHFTGDRIDYILAALASAYDDDRVKNKAAMTAYRIEHDQVPKQYFDTKTWKVLPEDVLLAAGIKDLRVHLSEKKIKQFVDGQFGRR